MAAGALETSAAKEETRLSSISPSVTRYQVVSPRLPEAFDGFRIVHLTDLHGRFFGRENGRLTALIEQLRPDLIAATGDMINITGDDGGAFLCLAKTFAEKCPFYFVTGNHEQNMSKRHGEAFYARLTAALAETGIRFPTAETLKRGNGSIRVCGYVLPKMYYRPFFDEEKRRLPKIGAEMIADEIGPCDRECFTLMLTHNPACFGACAQWGADLLLAGHLHGGMIRLPLLGGLLSPDWTIFPKYDAGLFREGGCTMIVGRGMGSNRKLRICNPPEVVLVTLGHAAG